MWTEQTPAEDTRNVSVLMMLFDYGDSSEREYPCVTQSRHRPIDIYELPDCLPHTVVEGGPAGPEVIEPLALLVRDHADPAGQHAVMRNTSVEGPLLAQKL